MKTETFFNAFELCRNMKRDRTTITVQRTVKERFLEQFGKRTIRNQSEMLETLIDENERLSEENQELRSQSGGGY